MHSEGKKIWIEKGYETFAKEGLNGLKIEPIAKIVGKSKSSFYHYFIDMENYINYLLNLHLERVNILSQKESECKSIDPELIQVLIDSKIDLLFNRELRVYRNEEKFAKIILESNQLVGNSFLKVWAKDLSLTETQLQGMFELSLENFFLQITSSNLEYEWLSNYFLNLKEIIKKIQKSNK